MGRCGVVLEQRLAYLTGECAHLGLGMGMYDCLQAHVVEVEIALDIALHQQGDVVAIGAGDFQRVVAHFQDGPERQGADGGSQAQAAGQDGAGAVDRHAGVHTKAQEEAAARQRVPQVI